MKYIDVSAHNGVIDFEKLKGNVDGVIIRAGYGRSAIDTKWVRNVTECNRLGIPCGAYWFSYAFTAEMAKNEAKQLLKAVAPYAMELPLAFDYEYDSVSYGGKQGATITAALVQEMTKAFCNEIEANGYYCMLYANPDYLKKYFGGLTDKYDLWLAQWPAKPNLKEPPRKCGIWQYTSNGQFDGITGRVDTNEAYTDYATFLRARGFNKLKPTEPDPEPEKPGEPAANQPWYAEAMAWCKSKGIMNDGRPNDAATRAEVAQVIYNLSKAFPAAFGGK